jgi:hypothetical protein
MGFWRIRSRPSSGLIKPLSYTPAPTIYFTARRHLDFYNKREHSREETQPPPMPTVTIPRPAPPSPPQQEQQQGKARSSMPNPGDVEIVDIRGASDEATVKKTMLEVLAGGQDGRPRKMPTMLLYDERGLQLFEAITHLDEYYLTNREINVLEKNAADMAAKIAPGTLLVELGSGCAKPFLYCFHISPCHRPCSSMACATYT